MKKQTNRNELIENTTILNKECMAEKTMSDFTKKNSVTGSIIENRISILNIIPSILVKIIAEYAVPTNRGMMCDREFRDIDTPNDVKALVIKRNPNLIFVTFTIFKEGRNS